MPLPHLPGSYHSALSPHLNLSTPICLQLKNQFSPCFSFFFTVASSFNLQGHLNPHKSKHSNQMSRLFKMSRHRWGTNPPSWWIGQFKRKMVNTGNYISRKRPFHRKPGAEGAAFVFVIERVYALISALRSFFLEKNNLNYLWMTSENQGFQKPLQVFCLLKWEDSY